MKKLKTIKNNFDFFGKDIKCIYEHSDRSVNLIILIQVDAYFDLY